MADSCGLDNVSTVSDAASYFDIDTPNISTTSSPTANRIQFNETDRDILNQCKDYVRTLQNLLQDIETKGSTDREVPAFPKSELLRIMGVNKREKKVLRGSELHGYLISKLVSVLVGPDGEISPPDPASKNATLQDLLLRLIQGYAILKTMNAKTLHMCLNYGLLLNFTYKAFEYSKGQGSVKGSWANWLITNVGISQSYARQLRDLSAKFAQYKTMHHLSIPIKDLYKLRYEIIHMLNSDQNIANFWLGN